MLSHVIYGCKAAAILLAPTTNNKYRTVHTENAPPPLAQSMLAVTPQRACSPNTMPVTSVRALEPLLRVSASKGACPRAPLTAAATDGLSTLPPAPAGRV